MLTLHNLAHQGLFDAGRLGGAGDPARRVHARRRRVLRPNLVPEGRAQLRRRDHHGQRNLRRGDHARRNSAAGSTACCASAPSEGRLTGILNGIERAGTRARTSLPLSARSAALEGALRRLYPRRLRAFACRARRCSPLSRGSAHQKGVDLVLGAAERIVERGGAARDDRTRRTGSRARALARSPRAIPTPSASGSAFDARGGARGLRRRRTSC